MARLTSGQEFESKKGSGCSGNLGDNYAGERGGSSGDFEDKML